MIYTVTFNPAIDYVVHFAQLRPGEINRNESEEFQFGGKGINVSNVLRTLGFDTVALGFVAGFIGEGFEKGLAQMGLKSDLIHVKEGMTRINVKVKAAEETEINGIGPVITEADMEQLYEKLDKIGPEDLLVNVLKYHPFLIKPNNHELGEIFGKVLKTDEEIADCARKLQELGGRNILVSMAGDGALLLDEQGQVHRIGCPKGKVLNSVGAGDSMVAGFLAGWLGKQDYDYALKLGTATGSATAFSIGLAEKPLIEQLLATL